MKRIYIRLFQIVLLMMPVSAANAQVYLNLSNGSISIGDGGSYTQGSNSGTATSFYIYMNNPSLSSNVTTKNGGTVNIVGGTDVPNSDYVIDKLKAWDSRATAIGRRATSNYINVVSNSNITIVLDNIWTNYVESDKADQSRTTGGIGFSPTADGASLTVQLKGDNRMNNVFYASSTFENCKLIFESASGANGTLTVGLTYPDRRTENSSIAGPPQVSDNWYDSVIGGSDATTIQDSDGIVINSGTIWAGAALTDNCTAIGAGGNGYGVVEINGGTVTAVTSSTGSAIGGGIGWTNYGGKGNVTITGGEVYAYNFGFAHVFDGAEHFVPAAAIGGGSSFMRSSNESTITISGGTVYAKSVGGTCIGGGGSGLGNGADCKVNISGGDITLSNISGYVPKLLGGTMYANCGTSIGGGTGGLGGGYALDGTLTAPGNGGSTDIVISGSPTIKAGSIGGGSTNSTPEWGGKIGGATIDISGGDIIGQFLMQGGGTKTCSFKMTAGKIHDSDCESTVYGHKKTDGGALWMDDASGTVNITGGTIDKCYAYNGGAIYMTAGTTTIAGGNITGCVAKYGSQCLGGAVYMGGGTFTMTGGKIGESGNGNSAKIGGGVYLGGNATFSMTASGSNKPSISYNSATGDGGGAYVSGVAGAKVFTFENGSISGNTSGSNGGAAYVKNGIVTIKSGEICLNTAQTRGGGIFAEAGTVNVSGNSLFSGNTATDSDGGAIYGGGGEITVSGGDIMKNNATKGNGGGIYASSSASSRGKITLTGTNLLENTAISGGGAYLASGTVTMTDGQIMDNTADGGSGAGIYIGNDTDNVITITNGKMENNTATLDGGAVYAGNGTITMSNANCLANSAKNGGALYASNGTINFNDGSVFKMNSASLNGGAVYVGGGTISLSNAVCQSNTAYNGGALYVSGGQITFTNGSQILSNTATLNGGGVFADGGRIDFNGTDANVSNLSENIASNGGGIYLSNGAYMAVQGVMLNKNKASMSEEDKRTVEHPKSAYYLIGDKSANIRGVGGGVYLQNGQDASHLTTLFFDITTVKKLGIFSNEADVAADDIFANGSYTQVIFPDIDGMKFEGFGGEPTGWYEDYMDNDEYYASGTHMNNRTGATGVRYRTAYTSGMNNFRVKNSVGSGANRYVCLALGDPFASLRIIAKGLAEGESALFIIKNNDVESVQKSNVYRVLITGTGEASMTRLVRNVPIGFWLVEQTDWSWGYNDNPSQVCEVSVKSSDVPTATFNFTKDTEKRTKACTYGESTEINEFSIKVTAVLADNVENREKKDTNNKEVDL